MIKKLTIKTWIGTGGLMLIMLALGVPMLWIYAPSAVEALQGGHPVLARKESMSNIYGLSVLGTIFVLMALIMLISQLKNSVKKNINKYLAAHSEVTLAMLDAEFAAAEKVGNIWVGRRFTFCNGLKDTLLENDRIVWVYTDTTQARRGVTYWLCFGLVDGTVQKVMASGKERSNVPPLYEKFPHILVGNNPEYGYKFKNDREAFLNIKYRQAQREQY